ncbi:MarR family transcriptional regulator [Gordonia sp. CPCC 206044]|uniref:MarR family winged helix-turn-helix transcriptional regulator n=1 Tax=Gordonia sp. CPCC 206044 TaxID=3140793 RepID=UPI003AF3EF60
MKESRAGGLATTASPSCAAAVHRDLIRIGRAVRSRAGAGQLSAGQMSALWTIAQNAPIRATELADREGVTAPTMSRLVGALENRGLVERTTDPHDGRVSLFALTTPGMDYIQGASSRKSELFEEALASLDESERDTIARAMQRLADTMCELDPHRADNTTTQEGA